MWMMWEDKKGERKKEGNEWVGKMGMMGWMWSKRDGWVAWACMVVGVVYVLQSCV